MWLILLSLNLLAGDVLSQALNFIDSDTDLLAVPSDQLIHSSAELEAVEDRFSELPFGARLPGYDQPLFSYSYTIGTDNDSTKPVTVQKFRPQQQREKSELTETTPTESTKNVIYLSNLNLPKRVITKTEDKSSLQGDLPEVSFQFPNKYEVDSKETTSPVKEYLPPKEISDPLRELSEYLPPKEISDPTRELSEYLPPKEISDPTRELSEYLPPKEISDPPRELSEYLPPKEISDPTRELSEYLPPKEISDPPRELTEYLPPKEIPMNEELRTDYLPPLPISENIRFTSEYLPLNQPSQKTPLPPSKVTGVFTKHPDSSVSLFVQESPTLKLPTSEKNNVHFFDGFHLQSLVPPVQNYQPSFETIVSPGVVHHSSTNEPVIARTETSKQEPYALVHESSDFPLQAKTERNKIDPYSIEAEQKTIVNKLRKYENPLSVGITDNAVYFPPSNQFHPPSRLEKPVSIVRETPTRISTSATSKTPVTFPTEIRHNQIVAKAEAPKIDPYSLVQEVKDVPIKVASERNKVDPYAIIADDNFNGANQNYDNCFTCLLETREQIRKDPVRIEAESYEKPSTRIQSKVSSSVRPYAVVAAKVDNKIVPSRYESNSLPYAVIDEYKTASLRPYQQKQRVNPLGVDSRIMNRPIVPQSIKANVPLPAVENTENIIKPPLRLYPKQSYELIQENNYGCLANDECNQNEICEHGKCILACTIANDLCIGDARCEARHHVPACVCPLMSIARTVTRAGYVQFDCMAMVMPANNVIQRTQTNTVNRYKASSYSRPIVQSPIRGGSFSSIRDSALPPAPPLGFGSSSNFGSSSSFGSSSAFASGSGDACNPSPCGPNTRCSTNANGIALCRCIEDYVPDGNTINGCKPQCVTDSDCPNDYNCKRQKCERVCARGACGHNANCDGNNHRAVCSCPSGHNGNPNVGGTCSQIAPIIRVPDDLPIDVCNPNPCGQNADCRERGDRPVCSCPRGYEGDPLSRCIKGECVEHNDCPNHLACQNLKCFDPCVGVCGAGSECTTRNHQPICSCPRNFIGDPFTSCRQLTEHDICNPTPCGLNTKCSVRNDRTSGSMRAVCSCIDNYLGNPLSECRPECVRDSDCNANQHCRENRCRNPCVDACGEGAYCDVRNNRAVCTCPEHFSGDPHSRCYPECTKHDDCPDYQACYLFKCIDPCNGACGTGADCKVEKHTPICSCPRGYTGDPFVSCRAFTLEDLCRDNPCGTNAECHPGKDRTGNDRPVCTCPRAYIGNPLVSCQRGECEGHNDCPDHQACYAYTCQSPCYTEVGSVCGNNADCKVRNHTPVCSCPRGYTGNPLTDCSIAPNARIAGHHRQQKKK